MTDSLGSSNLSRIEDELVTCFKGPVDVSVSFRRKLGDVWGGYFCPKSFARLFQGECVHTHLFHGC